MDARGLIPTDDPDRLRQIRRPMEEWTTIHHGVYPAYITWEQFLAHQERLADNASDAGTARPWGASTGLRSLSRVSRVWTVWLPDAGHLQTAATLHVYSACRKLWSGNVFVC